MNEQLLKIRHDKSAQDYPHLALQDGEYVELEFTRAAICVVLIWVLAAFSAALITVFIAVFNSNAGQNLLLPGTNATTFVNLAGIALYGLTAIVALIATRVFRGNRLYVTNKRAIQYEMISLFGSSVNIIDLVNIEDVSFKQSGVHEYIFGIGTLRMSTVGDETTYTFKYTYKPTDREMHTLTSVVSAAKSRKKKHQQSE